MNLKSFQNAFRLKDIPVYLALMFIWGPIASHANPLIEKAAEAYSQEDYPAATKLYERILAGGSHSFEIYYNLGNAYFKQGEIAQAILNYERASRLNPADEDLQHNLAVAQARTVDKIDLLPAPDLITGYKSFVNIVTADQWGIFSIAAFILCLMAIASFLILPARWVRQASLVLAGLFLFSSLLFFFWGWQQQSWLNDRKEAIIFSPSVTISSSPDPSGAELFVLHEGTKVRIEERFRNWVRIRIGDGNNGWVPKEALEEI